MSSYSRRSGTRAFLLRFEFNIPSWQFAHLVYALLIWVLMKSTVFQLFGVDRVTWRLFLCRMQARFWQPMLLRRCSAHSLFAPIAPRGFPRSIYLIDLALCLLFTSGIRSGRMVAEASSTFRKPVSSAGRLFMEPGPLVSCCFAKLD